MKFRKKQVIVQAVQWDGNRETISKISEIGCKVISAHDELKIIQVVTPQGSVALGIGEWLVRECENFELFSDSNFKEQFENYADKWTYLLPRQLEQLNRIAKLANNIDRVILGNVTADFSELEVTRENILKSLKAEFDRVAREISDGFFARG